MKGSRLAWILAGVLAATGIASMTPQVYDAFRHRYDKPYINLTRGERPFHLYGKSEDQEEPVKELVVRTGEPVWVFNAWSDVDGIRKTRFYINEVLRTETEVRMSDGLFLGYIAGMQNGWRLDTTEKGFRHGENSLTVETEDSLGNITRDTAKVILNE